MSTTTTKTWTPLSRRDRAEALGLFAINRYGLKPEYLRAYADGTAECHPALRAELRVMAREVIAERAS